MAKEQPLQKKPANLSVEQMKSGIARIEQRIAELEGIGLNAIEIEHNFESAVDPIRKKVNSTLKDILGLGSIEYSEYELPSFYPHHFQFGESLEERRVHYTNELRKAALQLKALKEVLEERVAHAAPSQESSASQPSPTPNTGKVFIVHGHDNGVKETVARFIGQLGMEPVILHEQSDQGRTVIEKLLDHAADADFAIVLFTPDDMGYPVKNPDDRKPRARQNVVLELGLFLGLLGRKRVALLHTGDVEIPSDYSGVLYLPFDDNGAWKYQLAKEPPPSRRIRDTTSTAPCGCAPHW